MVLAWYSTCWRCCWCCPSGFDGLLAMNLVLPSSTFSWFLRWSLRLKALLQISHRNVLVWEWINTCLFSLNLEVNFLSQPEQHIPFSVPVGSDLTWNLAFKGRLPGVGVLVLPQLPRAGEWLEALLAGVSKLGLDSVHQELGVVQIIVLVWRLQRELSELLLLLGTILGTLYYGQTLSLKSNQTGIISSAANYRLRPVLVIWSLWVAAGCDVLQVSQREDVLPHLTVWQHSVWVLFPPSLMTTQNSAMFNNK